MNGNFLKVIAACVALGSTAAFAQTHHKKSWFQAVVTRNRTGSAHHHSRADIIRDQKYMEGLRRHHDWARLAEFQRREGYPVDAPRRDRDRHDKDHHDNGLHKGWSKGRHNPHHD